MDVEFLGPHGGALGTDAEELDTRRPPNRRRRLALGAAGAAVAIAAAGVLIAQHHGGGGHPAAAASTSPAPPSGPPTLVHPSVLPDSGLTTVDTNAPAVIVGDTFTTIAGDSVIRVESRGVPNTQTVPLTHPSDQYVLVADAAGHRIWVVREGAPTTEVTAYGSRGPAGLALRAGADGTAEGAALLDHVLYVTTDIGVYRVSFADGSVKLSRTTIRGGRSIAADPSRHRLLLVDMDSAQAQVRAQRPDQVESIATAPLPFGKGEVQVADGQIWAGGFGNGESGQFGAVLARLDPGTLRPVAHSPLESQLGPGAIIVAAGTHSLLVRSGADSSPLWCIDARNGAIVRTWPNVPGAVVIGPDGVQELDAAGAASAQLSGPECS